MANDSIEDRARQMAAALEAIDLFHIDGHTIELSIIENGRRKRKSAAADTWDPVRGEIRIKYHRMAAPAVAGRSPQTSAPRSMESPDPHTSQCLDDAVRTLAEAESRPGYNFVALKWFRDRFLPARGFAWAGSPQQRDEILRQAIEGQLVSTEKIANPKNPQFPTTVVKLNRSNAHVRAILGLGNNARAIFNPMPVRGEPVSETILRDRAERR